MAPVSSPLGLAPNTGQAVGFDYGRLQWQFWLAPGICFWFFIFLTLAFVVIFSFLFSFEACFWADCWGPWGGYYAICMGFGVHLRVDVA